MRAAAVEAGVTFEELVAIGEEVCDGHLISSVSLSLSLSLSLSPPRARARSLSVCCGAILRGMQTASCRCRWGSRQPSTRGISFARRPSVVRRRSQPRPQMPSSRASSHTQPPTMVEGGRKGGASKAMSCDA
jgi:hypothetical protein